MTNIDESRLRELSRQYKLLPSQTIHRANILQNSSIQDGSRILEIGCGQGDCTSVLAFLYPNAVITAIDPGPSDYGTPETLGQAHSRIKDYDIGSRINFLHTTPTAHLESVNEGAYDVAVLCHCLWYFSSREDVKATLKALKTKAKKLVIAEHGLKSSSREGDAHILAAMTRAACEAHIPDSDHNIRTPISPADIQKICVELGWRLMAEEWTTPHAGLEDARWETQMLLGGGGDSDGTAFLNRAKCKIQDERVILFLESMIESVKSTVKELGGQQNVRCMDVWIGIFE